MSDVYSYQGAQTRLVPENDYGVLPGSPAAKRLEGFGVLVKPAIQKNRFAPPGAMIATTGTLDDDFTTGSVEGIVDFNGLAYVLAGRFGQPTVTALGGAPAAFQWDWSWDGRRPLRPRSYHCYRGFNDVADIVPGLVFNDFSVEGGRADGFTVSGNVFGKKMTTGQNMIGVTKEVQTITETGTVTAGTWLLTIVEINATTTAIAFDANTAAIQAAIDALPGIRTGDIVVAGGPVHTTPATLTYGGPYFSGRNVALATVNSAGLTGGTYSVAETTPGADTVTTIPAVPAGALMADVWLDSTFAGVGTTQLLHAYTMTMEVPEGQMRVRPMNSSLSSDDIIDASEQEMMLSLTLGINAVERARLAQLRLSQKEFVRVRWLGGVISGANNYMLRIDAAVDWDDPGDEEDVDSVLARPWNGAIMIDPTANKAIDIRLVNAISGL